MIYDFCVGVERKTVRVQPWTFSMKKRTVYGPTRERNACVSRINAVVAGYYGS